MDLYSQDEGSQLISQFKNAHMFKKKKHSVTFLKSQVLCYFRNPHISEGNCLIWVKQII